jgi:hypothetical protein
MLLTAGVEQVFFYFSGIRKLRTLMREKRGPADDINIVGRPIRRRNDRNELRVSGRATTNPAIDRAAQNGITSVRMRSLLKNSHSLQRL